MANERKKLRADHASDEKGVCMRVRTGGRSVEIPDERVGGGQGMPTKKSDGSNPSPSPLPGWPKQADKWNYAYAQFLAMEKHAGNIKWWWYEAFSIWLVPPNKATKDRGLRHRVDFLVWQNDGTLTMIEVKGRSLNLRDGITRYKIAREKFPCFAWKIVKRKGHGWEEIII